MPRDPVREKGEHNGNCMERGFENFGEAVGSRPCASIAAAVFVAMCCGAGMAFGERENRPDQQWIAQGSPALVQDAFLKQQWPSNQRFNFWVTTCKDKTKPCNVLEAKYIQRFWKVYKGLLNLTVNGTELVAETELKYKKEPPGTFDMWKGIWSFDGTVADANGERTKSSCFKFGPFCGKSSILPVFREDDAVISTLTDESSLYAINYWEGQENMCPITIARKDSPCVDTRTFYTNASANVRADDCQKYDSKQQRANCRKSAENYCKAVCPTRAVCRMVPSMDVEGNPTTKEQCQPMKVDKDNCKDNGCLLVQGFANIEEADTSSGTNGTGGAPAGAFSFEPFKLKTILGGIKKDATGKVVSATSMFSFLALGQKKIYVKADGNEVDLLSDEWEKRALCMLGIKARGSPSRGTAECPGDELLHFDPNFSRSFGDEFGGAITGDLVLFGAACAIIAIYLITMISDWSKPCFTSNIGMALCCLLVVGLSYVGGTGLGNFCGIKGNQLSNLVPFLILGLGVDDAFVLSAEFNRVTREYPGLSVSRRTALTSKYGGMSVLITSATDALAFLIGSATVLPALGWFCQFSGICVVFCFLFQMFVYLPALALDASRREHGYMDVCCCCRSGGTGRKGRNLCRFEWVTQEPPNDDATVAKYRPSEGNLSKGLAGFMRAMVSPVGKVITIALFGALLGMGVAGIVQLKKDFKIEWFIPDNSYVRDFFKVNEEEFKSGVDFTVYVRKVDYFASQPAMRNLHTYLNETELCDKNEGVTNWHHEFMEAQRTAIANDAPTNELNARTWLDANGDFKNRSTFYNRLHNWYRDGSGVRYRNSIKWADAACENSTLDTWLGPSCNSSNGLNGTRLSAMIDLKWSTFGDQRYETLMKLRRNISNITATATLMPGAATGKMMDGSVGSSALPVAFPFSFNFLYWEEMGIIDEELWRNLAICGGVILCMVLLMIWIPRVSVFVVLAIFMSIVDVVGFLHWWGVTISGTSTIYILISVGLAVDYSAHVAHMFKESTGTANERAEKALGRIGPSVFHAVVSTFLAVVTMAASESYIFRIFFKALFLVTVIAGAHGLWFLPVILSVFGGANRAGEHGPSGKGEPADLCGSKPVKPSAVVDPAAAKAAEAGGPVVAASVSDTDVVVAKASNAAVEEV